MSTIPELQATVAAAQARLELEQAGLDAANLEVSQLSDQLTSLNAQLPGLKSSVALAQADLTKAQAALSAAYGHPHLGGWGSTTADFTRWEDIAGRTFDIFRSRGGEGQFDRSWLLSDTLAKSKAGYIVSLQCQPKTGTGSNRIGISYKDLMAGKFDLLITSELEKFKQLPKGVKNLFEPLSEFNVQNPAPDAQPFFCTAAQYGPFVRYIHDMAVRMGVRNRLLFTPSANPQVWNTAWRQWVSSITDIIDGLAVDFYSQPKTGGVKKMKTPAEGTTYVIKAARSIKKPWMVLETGTQEHPADPNYKANWYGQWRDLLRTEGRDCYCVFFNTSNDGPGGWMPDTSPQALAAWKSLVNDRGVWY